MCAETYCAYGCFGRHSFPIQHCHPVLDFAGGHVRPAAYSKETPDCSSDDNARAAVGQSSGYISSWGICLYGVVYCDLWAVPIHLRVFGQ